MGILIPEIIIERAVQAVLKMTRDDYQSYTDKQKSVLYYIFGKDEDDQKLKFDTFVWFDQAVVVIIGDERRKREIAVNFGYNMKRMEVPTIHIMLPSESPLNSGIGSNEGYQEPIVDEAKNITYPVYTQNNQVTYNLLLTSDNYHEVLIMYNFLKATFLSVKSQLELQGLQNVTFGGSDMNFDESLVPPNIFHRNFNVSFTYDYSSIDFFASKYGEDFKACGKIEE